MKPLPKFDAPPVIETVLGVQFKRLAGFSILHIGQFWKEYLGKEWTNVEEAPPADDVFERFDEGSKLFVPPQARIRTGPVSPRVQIIHEDKERMVQIQNTRFIYNWRKRERDYPSYETLLPEFHERLEHFRKFLGDLKLPELNFNQWEVIYVNQIPKGELWKSPSDWVDVFPGLNLAAQISSDLRLESLAMNWRLMIGENRGRLHISINHVTTSQSPPEEILALQLTARGPIETQTGLDLEGGLTIGHETIVRCFEAITSSKAHEYWKRKA
jgi:uncharacterized protein (TIGR04255 family)